MLETCIIDHSHALTLSHLRRYIEYHGINKLYAEYKKDVHAKNKGCYIFELITLYSYLH